MTVKDSWGMVCPSCGEDDSLEIAATIWVRLFDNGTDTDEATCHDHEWSDDSACKCASCDWTGTVAAATVRDDSDWSGSPDPSDPDNFWIDDKTGERVNAQTGERAPSAT